MNWLNIGLFLGVLYFSWLIFLVAKRRFNRSLLFIALAQAPYILINLAAPVRGFLDEGYAGYNVGLISIPPGWGVTLVASSMIAGALFIASKALLNQMDKVWTFTFLFDMFLLILIALPSIWEIIISPDSFKIELGEFLTISGVVVFVLMFLVFTFPLLYSLYVSAKNIIKTYNREVVRG